MYAKKILEISRHFAKTVHAAFQRGSQGYTTSWVISIQFSRPQLQAWHICVQGVHAIPKASRSFAIEPPFSRTSFTLSWLVDCSVRILSRRLRHREKRLATNAEKQWLGYNRPLQDSQHSELWHVCYFDHSRKSDMMLHKSGIPSLLGILSLILISKLHARRAQHCHILFHGYAESDFNNSMVYGISELSIAAFPKTLLRKLIHHCWKVNATIWWILMSASKGSLFQHEQQDFWDLNPSWLLEMSDDDRDQGLERPTQCSREVPPKSKDASIQLRIDAGHFDSTTGRLKVAIQVNSQARSLEW